MLGGGGGGGPGFLVRHFQIGLFQNSLTRRFSLPLPDLRFRVADVSRRPHPRREGL